jgi:hypothetical protein
MNPQRQRDNILRFPIISVPPRVKSNDCSMCPSKSGQPCPYREYAAKTIDNALMLQTALQTLGT